MYTDHSYSPPPSYQAPRLTCVYKHTHTHTHTLTFFVLVLGLPGTFKINAILLAATFLSASCGWLVRSSERTTSVGEEFAYNIWLSAAAVSCWETSIAKRLGTSEIST